MVELDFTKILGEKKIIFDPNIQMTQKAYDKICDIWNKDEKSRKFLKHIISSFFPINPWNKLLYKKDSDIVKCAILNHNLTGISNISESLSAFVMKKMFIDVSCVLEGDLINDVKTPRQYTKEEQKELNDLRNSLPIPIREGDFAYLSKVSDKYMSNEACIALQQFIEILLINGNKEMSGLVKYMRISQTKDEFDDDSNTELKLRTQDFEEKQRKEQKQIAKEILESKAPKLSDNINEDTLSKLEALKLKMESNG